MEKLLLTPREACLLLGIGKSSLFKLLKSGQLESFLLGRLRKIPRAGVERLIAAKVAEAEDDRV